MSYDNKLHILPTNYHLLTAQQEPHTKYKKPVSVAKDTEEFSEKRKKKIKEKKSREWATRTKKLQDRQQGLYNGTQTTLSPTPELNGV